MTAVDPEHTSFAGDLVGLLLSRPPAVERLPVEVLTQAEVAVELGRVQQRKAMEAAYEAELLMAMAAASSEADDPAPDAPGARRRNAGSPVPGTSEFLAEELALLLNCSRRHAAGLLFDAHVLVERMPPVWAECADGRLDWHRARVFADVLGSATDEVVPAVLPAAASLSAGTLRRRLIAAAVAADEEFAERRRIEAERRAEVKLYPTADGMSRLATDLPSPVAAAMWSTIDQAAQLARTAGDDRPIGVLRAEAHAALVLNPGGAARPPVTAHLTVLAPLSALRPPGSPARTGAAVGECVPEVDGRPITAAHLRELLAQLGALGVQAPPGGSLALAVTGDDGALLATTTPAELARLAARGCPTHGRDDDCGCPVLTAPGAVNGYARSAAQERFLRLRDRTCRHPGCGQPAARTDLDHVVPHDCGGRTACDNLCCLCRTHHRLKTFARGWRFVLQPDGTLRVTTPSGITRTTRPPGLRDQRALPPPAPPPPDHDPPPF